MDQTLRIAALAGSTRRGSLNRRLLARAVEALEAVEGTDVVVDVLDLRQAPLPLYDGDIQARDGVPPAAVELHDRLAAADAIVIANPEYNGGYPALFKNAIDWISRVDMFVFHPRYLGLLSATPGKGGGARGIDHTRALFHNMFVTVHVDGFGLPGADGVLGEDGWADGAEHEADRLAAWAASFVAEAVAHRSAREADAA